MSGNRNPDLVSNPAGYQLTTFLFYFKIFIFCNTLPLCRII